MAKNYRVIMWVKLSCLNFALKLGVGGRFLQNVKLSSFPNFSNKNNKKHDMAKKYENFTFFYENLTF